MNTHALYHFPLLMEFCPVDAHISLNPNGLEAGQKADRRSACASILGTPEGSGCLGEKIPLTFAATAFPIQSPFSPSMRLDRWLTKKGGVKCCAFFVGSAKVVSLAAVS
jgi:hypothetical protein